MTVLILQVLSALVAMCAIAMVFFVFNARRSYVGALNAALVSSDDSRIDVGLDERVINTKIHRYADSLERTNGWDELAAILGRTQTLNAYKEVPGEDARNKFLSWASQLDVVAARSERAAPAAVLNRPPQHSTEISVLIMHDLEVTNAYLGWEAVNDPIAVSPSDSAIEKARYMRLALA